MLGLGVRGAGDLVRAQARPLREPAFVHGLRFRYQVRMEALSRLRLVLLRPRNPENLGAVARAIAFAIEQPDDVEIGDITIRPAIQN